MHIILSAIGAIIGFIVANLATIKKLITAIREKKLLQQSSELCNLLLPLITEAEQFAGLSGEEKKTYVISKAKEYAEEHIYAFDETMISGKIEDIIQVTKNVNKPAEKE